MQSVQQLDFLNSPPLFSHCEFATIDNDDFTQSAPVPASSNPTEQNLTILIFLGVVAVFGLLSIVCVVAITGKNKTQSSVKRERRAHVPPPSAFPTSPVSDSGAPEISNGGASTSTGATNDEKVIAEENEIIWEKSMILLFMYNSKFWMTDSNAFYIHPNLLPGACSISDELA